VNIATAMRTDRDILDDFAIAAEDFGEVDDGPTVKAFRTAFVAIRKAVEVARQEEQAAAYWTKKVNDWTSWSRMPESDLKRRAARLLVGGFEDSDTAFDFLTCPPLDGPTLTTLSTGGRSPSNAYEVFAATRRGGRRWEAELAELGGPVERYTYRLRMLRGLGESRSKIYRWRQLNCRFRLLNSDIETAECQTYNGIPGPDMSEQPTLVLISNSKSKCISIHGIQNTSCDFHGHVRDGP
jgi:hypothetical protein